MFACNTHPPISDVYPMYVQDFTDREQVDQIVKSDTFKKHWNENFSYRRKRPPGRMWVKLCNVEAGKCNVCLDAGTECRSGSPAQRASAKQR